MKTRERLDQIARTFQSAERFVGEIDTDALERWLKAELGDAAALDRPVPRGDLVSQAVPPRFLLHVVSGNTPHAAFQSLLRGLVLGCKNRIKIPSAGLPEFEAFVAALPPALAARVTLSKELPNDWVETAEAAVIFGSDATVEEIRNRLPASARFIAHGHRLSLGIVLDPDEEAAALAAADASLFDQQGCLSLHAIYVRGGAAEVRDFAAKVAVAMEAYHLTDPRADVTPSESGAIRNAREIVRFRAANGHDAALWESRGSTAWTVVFETSPTLRPSPLNRYLTVHPLPEDLAALGPETAHLSTVAIHPFSPEIASRFIALPATRFCPLGRAQQPSIFWHHDGLPTLGSLVTWRDFG